MTTACYRTELLLREEIAGGSKPKKSFHEIVVVMVESDLTQERDA